MKKRSHSRWASGFWLINFAIVALGLTGILGNTNFASPPRFDGAGYSVLSRSLLEGSGYRQIEHPDRPLHAHFPPGYPITLAAVWSLTGISVPVAHLLSVTCAVSALLCFHSWFRTLFEKRTAALLGLALACNWRWHREGGAILSEPLFFLVTALVFLLSRRATRSEKTADAAFLGFALGWAILTRHVAIALAVAVVGDLLLRRRGKMALITTLMTAIVVAPWALWLASARQPTQVDLLAHRNLVAMVAGQAWFYVLRLPDQILGPVVEIGTVFRPRWAPIAAAWAVLASAIVGLGWFRTMRHARRRVVGLVPMVTLCLLVVWPFTEAGRFLVPLIPMILVGAVEGLAALLETANVRRARTWSACLILALSIPYSIYAVATNRAEAQRQTNAAFDRACEWINAHGERPGPLLTTHPGEVFWQTGRLALSPGSDDPDVIATQIQSYGVAYLIVDKDRYARAPANPLSRFVAERPDLVDRVWAGDTESDSIGPRVAIDAVRRAEPPPGSH